MRIPFAVLGTVLCLTIACWATLINHWSGERERVISAAVDRNDQLSVAFGEYVTRTLHAADAITEFVRLESIAVGPQAALSSLVDSSLIKNDLFEGLHVLDVSGRVVATTGARGWIGLNMSDRDHFTTHAAEDTRNLYIGHPLDSTIVQKRVIPISRRLNLANGDFGGTVIVLLAPDRVSAFFQSAQLVEHDYITLIGDDGIARASRTGRQSMSGEDLRSTSLFQAAQRAPWGHIRTLGKRFDGLPRYGSFRKLAGYPLFAAVSVSEKDVLSDFRARRHHTLVVALIGTGALFVISILFALACARRDQALKTALESEDALRHSATHDTLTGLPNRTYLEAAAAQMLSVEPQSTVCMFLDLDNFKHHNDAHGHEVGDAILRSVAARLTETLPTEAVISRLGGDEFVVLIPQRTCEDASQLAVSILSILETPSLKWPTEITATASIGVSMCPEHGRTLSQLLKHADLAMYQAKRAGRSAFRMYDKGEGRGARERANIEAELRKAVRHGELELYYQPKIDLASRRAAGVEALVRWNHPSLGWIAPAEFIPIAEQSGLILPIGDWVLRTACEQSRAWADLGLPIAVNFSPLQFEKPNIVEEIAELLLETGVSPEMIELELTESMIIQNPEKVRSKLCRLKDLGLTIALDDFGTGYSNLQYLRRLPIDTLKIDRSFVADIPFDADAVAVARAIIGLGRSLGFNVVAEGVEQVGQAEFLAGEGCSLAQGFLFAAPMAPNDCRNWLVGSSEFKGQGTGLVRGAAHRVA